MASGEARFGTVNFEKRMHPRFSIDLPVEYWKIDGREIRPGHTGNISEGGLLLYLPEQTEIGQNLKLRLYIDSGLDFISIEALAEVVWKDFRGGEKGEYRSGVKFMDISLKNMGNLKNFLNSLMDLKSSSPLDIPPKLLSTQGMPNAGNLSNLISPTPDQD